jgi:tetratricopeptide (TPR) repeat protein
MKNMKKILRLMLLITITAGIIAVFSDRLPAKTPAKTPAAAPVKTEKSVTVAFGHNTTYVKGEKLSDSFFHNDRNYVNAEEFTRALGAALMYDAKTHRVDIKTDRSLKTTAPPLNAKDGVNPVNLYTGPYDFNIDGKKANHEIVFCNDKPYISLRDALDVFGLRFAYKEPERVFYIEENFETSMLSKVKYDLADYDASFKAWQSWLNKQDYGTVRADYKKYAKKNANMTKNADFMLGNRYYADKDRENAIKAYALCLEENPYHVPAMNNMAVCFIETRNYWQALEMLYIAIKCVNETADELLYDSLSLNYATAFYLAEGIAFEKAYDHAEAANLNRRAKQGASDPQIAKISAMMIYNAIWLKGEASGDAGINANDIKTLKALEKKYPGDPDYKALREYYEQLRQ